MKREVREPLDKLPARTRTPPARGLFARGLFVAILCGACFLPGAVCAQTVFQPESAPPRKFVPEEDRARLSQTKNVKDRMKLTFQLAEERLQRAAAHTESERYLEAGGQLGIYQALIGDLMRFVQYGGRGNDRSRDIFKRIDLALRAHVPRLETLRRITPSEEAVHVRDCIEFVRDARTKALESFYDDTVLRLPPESRNDDANDAGSKKDERGDNSQGGNTQGSPEKKPEQD